METAFKTADILLPHGVDMEKWSVVACDQHTSEPEYWEKTAQIVKGQPSTLELIFPEVYLKDNDADKRISRIHENMEKYLADGIFDEYKNAMIYVERMTSDGLRTGIVGAVDLEEYDYRQGSTLSVRATEATVTERIPPRVKIRSEAVLELAHILLLIDDSDKKVIEPLAAKKSEMKKLYDFDLMQQGGHISGYLMTSEDIESVQSALCSLGSREEFDKRYSLPESPVLLFAMGDGNHSLASAKEYYERLKAASPDKDFSHHPARYALCEIVNLHSEALRFEAIHRIVKNTDPELLLSEMTRELMLSETEKSHQYFTAVIGETEKTFYIRKPSSNLAVGSVQNFLDGFIAKNNGTVDYIHGEQVVRRLAADKNSIGFLLPDMAKEELFPAVIKDGALPRKTFSMGRAEDKRYYTECRRIREE